LRFSISGSPSIPIRAGFGKALKGHFSGLWRYRVGDYRLVCQIRDRELLILVLRVGDRKDIYK
jgi:mRNA interferase RelE/StbE